MLVTSKKLLLEAQREGYAIGAFNASNLELVKAIINAAENLESPVIVETTPKAIEYAGLKYLSVIIKKAAEMTHIPVVLHLDHGLSVNIVEECLEEGYTGIMIDGSHLSLDKNISLTQEVILISHRKKIPVEGELGEVTAYLRLTNPDEVSYFVRQTNIDSLAVAIGSSHGHAKDEKLNLELLEKIRKKTDIPLVLHGASGVSDSDIKEAIKRGICKINIDTEIREVFTEAVKNSLKNQESLDPRIYLKKGEEKVRELIERKIKLFGSAYKAPLF